ncbi:hypothetical protein Ancab_015920 [Ancistrocladus abbreviatus]
MPRIPADSPAQKLEGALLNAAVFILVIAAVTFLLVVLYYYNFTNFLKNYMRLSAFFVLGTMGGAICLSFIKHFSIPIDAVTCFVFLFNFTVLGVISVFGRGVPIVVTQAYMVALGIIVAAWFTQLPEWTTWTLLVALAIYDLVAVLAPGGPLKILVELSQSRDDDLPALVYEARPTVSRGGPTGGGGRRGTSLGLLVGGVSDNGSVELQAMSQNAIEIEGENDGKLDVEAGEASGRDEEEGETSPLVPENLRERESRSLRSEVSEIDGGAVDEEMSPLVEMLGMGGDREEDGESELSATRGIKLGLGDFVFYSVLVGRAAMYDLMTVYACYLAIISGLGCTLILLSACRRALPALPISITLGVLFYFLTRLLMEPFVVGTSTNLIMF